MAGSSPNEFDEFEREALAQLPALMSVARRLARTQAEAEDLVQDTLLKAIRARGHYQPGTHLKAWLFKILRNTFINRYHRGQLERSLLGSSAPDPIADGWISAASMRSMRDADGNALRPELEQHLKRAMDQLPEEFRAVVLLADVEEFSYREIAETLDCPIGTVMSRLHRGRKLLRGHLVDVARETGILAPEAFIGDSSSDRVRAASNDADAPVDLTTYREGRSVAGGKPRGRG